MAPQTRHLPPSDARTFASFSDWVPGGPRGRGGAISGAMMCPMGEIWAMSASRAAWRPRVACSCGGRLGAPGHLAKQRLVLGRRARGPDLILARARISYRAAVYTQMRRTRRHDGVRRSARGKGDVVAFWWPAGRFGAREPRPTRPLSANYSPACASRSVTCERYCCPARAVRLAAGHGQRTTHRHWCFSRG